MLEVLAQNLPPLTDLLILAAFIIIAILILGLIIGAIIWLLPAIIVAAVVWFITGNTLLTGIAFLAVVLLGLLRR